MRRHDSWSLLRFVRSDRGQVYIVSVLNPRQWLANRQNEGTRKVPVLWRPVAWAAALFESDQSDEPLI